MGIRFDIQVRAFEDGQHAFDQQVGFELNDFAEPIAASQRMVEEFARGYHGIKNPSPVDLNNVMCNELFHLIRRAAGATDQRLILFVSGSLLRLCAQPEGQAAFSGLGRHPTQGERLMLTLQRRNTGEGKAQHNASIVPLDMPTPLGTA